jgi:hypothetical protein
MLLKAQPRREETNLEQVIARRIQQRTWGRIHDLQVQVAADGVTVHGHTCSYYAKQLAISAIREVVESTPVKLDIEVVPGVVSHP